MNIILFGFKKCGKSYYGLKAAQKLHMHFVDSDLLIEKVYTQIYHKTLSYRDIVRKHGFPFFRMLEKLVLPLLMSEKNSLISLGGGMVLDPENVERLQELGPLIFLKVPKEVLQKRILSSDPPAYIDSNHPIESFDAFYQERLPIYESIPSHVIEMNEDSEEESLEKLIDLISEIKKKEKP